MNNHKEEQSLADARLLGEDPSFAENSRDQINGQRSFQQDSEMYQTPASQLGTSNSHLSPNQRGRRNYLARASTVNRLDNIPSAPPSFAGQPAIRGLNELDAGHVLPSQTRSYFDSSDSSRALVLGQQAHTAGMTPSSRIRKRSIQSRAVGVPIARNSEIKPSDFVLQDEMVRGARTPFPGSNLKSLAMEGSKPDTSMQNYTFSRMASIAQNDQRTNPTSPLKPGSGTSLRKSVDYLNQPQGLIKANRSASQSSMLGEELNSKALFRNLRKIQLESQQQQAKESARASTTQCAAADNKRESIFNKLSVFMKAQFSNSTDDKGGAPLDFKICREDVDSPLRSNLQQYQFKNSDNTSPPPSPNVREQKGRGSVKQIGDDGLIIERRMIDSGSNSEDEKEIKPKFNWVFRHPSKWLDTLAVLVQVVIGFESIFVPMEIAFPELQRTYLQILPQSVLMLDFFIKCRTAIQNGATQQEITAPKQILKAYSKTLTFYIDLIAAMPLAMIAQIFAPSSTAASALNLLRLVKAVHLWNEVGVSKKSEQFKLIGRLLKLIVFLFVYIHVTACLLYYTATLDKVWKPNIRRFNRETAEDFYQKSVGTKYLACCYISVMMLTGNDIDPESDFQIALVAFLTIIGALMIANVFGTMAVVFTAMNRKNQKLQESIDLANASMTNMKLPNFLQDNIRQFMLATQNNLDNQTELDQFMSMISPSLRNQVTKYIFMGAVSSNPVFRGASDQLDFLISDVSTLLFLPEDIIVRQGQHGDSLFLIAKGDCQVWVNDHLRRSMLVRSMGQADYFGEISLLMETPRTATVKSSNYCTLACLEKKVFFSLCSNFPDILIQMKRRAVSYDDPWKKFKSSLLQGVDYFSNNSPEFFSELQYHMEEENFDESAQIFKKGEECYQISFIVEGKAQIQLEDEDGNPIGVTMLQEGDLFGQYTVLRGDILRFQMKAFSKVRCLTLPQEFLWDNKDLIDGLSDSLNKGEHYIETQGLPYLDYVKREQKLGGGSSYRSFFRRRERYSDALRASVKKLQILKQAGHLKQFISGLDFEKGQDAGHWHGSGSNSRGRYYSKHSKFSPYNQDDRQRQYQKKRRKSLFQRHSIMSQGDSGGVTLQEQIAKLQEMILNQQSQKQPEVTNSLSSSSSSSSSQSSVSLHSIPEQAEEATEELSFANSQSFDLMTKSLAKKTTSQSPLPKITVDPLKTSSSKEGYQLPAQDQHILNDVLKGLRTPVVVEEEKAINLSEISSSVSEPTELSHQVSKPELTKQGISVTEVHPAAQVQTVPQIGAHLPILQSREQPTSSKVVRLPPLVKQDNEESKSFSLEEIQEEPLQFSSPGLTADPASLSLAHSHAIKRQIEDEKPSTSKKNDDIFGLLPMKSIAELPDERQIGPDSGRSEEERKMDLRKLKLPSNIITSTKEEEQPSSIADLPLDNSSGLLPTTPAEATPDTTYQRDYLPSGLPNNPEEETKEQPKAFSKRPRGLKRRTLNSELNVGLYWGDQKHEPDDFEKKHGDVAAIVDLPLRHLKIDSVVSPLPKVLPMEEVESHSTCARQDESEFEKKLTRQVTKKGKKKKKGFGKISRAQSKEETLKFTSLTTPDLAKKVKDRQSAVVGPLRPVDLLLTHHQEHSPEQTSTEQVSPERVSPDFHKPADPPNFPYDHPPSGDSSSKQLKKGPSSKQTSMKSSVSLDASGGQGSFKKPAASKDKDKVLKKLLASKRPSPLTYGRPKPRLNTEEEKDSDSVSKDSVSAVQSEDVLKDLSRKIYVLSERSKEESEENLPVISLSKQKTSNYKLEPLFPMQKRESNEIKQPSESKDHSKNTVKRRISNGLAPFIKRDRTPTYKKRKQI